MDGRVEVDSEPEEAERDAPDLLEDVWLYLREKKYRDGITQNQKRVIRKKALNFYLTDAGEMIYKKKQKGKNEVGPVS